MNKVNILGVNVDMIGIDDAAEKIFSFLNSDSFHSVYTPNSEIIMLAYQDTAFCELLNRSDMLTADGIGVVYASKILKHPISERAAGYDIAVKIAERLPKTTHKLFILGGKPGVADEAKSKLETSYPGIQIVGTQDGYFPDDKLPTVIDNINQSGADLLFVCFGAPRQEKWIDENRDKLNVRVAMGIGGSVDVFAGQVLRAPMFWQKMGLEWFYRLLREPWRFMRMMSLPKFALTVLFKGKKYPQEDV